MPDLISHAEMIAAVRQIVLDADDDPTPPTLTHDEVAILSHVLAHLERTQWRDIEEAPGLAQRGDAWTWFLAQRSAFEDEFEVVRVSDRNSDFPFVTPSGHHYAEDSFIKWMMLPLPPSPETPR